MPTFERYVRCTCPIFFQGIVESGKVFQPNHFVHLMFYEPTGGEERKLPTQNISSNLQKSNSKKISNGNLVQSKISFPFVSTPDPLACSVPIVKNIMTQVQELSSFFNNSQNQQIIFEKNILIQSKDSKKKKLKDVCRTRWVERVDGMNVFEDLFIPIFFTLKEMSLNEERQCNPSTSSQAMVEERLNGLALMEIHQDIEPSVCSAGY